MSRANDRFDQRLPVDFLVSVVGNEGRAMNRARNLSSGGVQLERGFDGFEPEEELELTLRLPEARSPVCCSGTVVYERGSMAGLSFTHLASHGQAQIDAFIAGRLTDGGTDRAPRPDPSRVPRVRRGR
jgi:hypothetical protein